MVTLQFPSRKMNGCLPYVSKGHYCAFPKRIYCEVDAVSLLQAKENLASPPSIHNVPYLPGIQIKGYMKTALMGAHEGWLGDCQKTDRT